MRGQTRISICHKFTPISRLSHRFGSKKRITGGFEFERPIDVGVTRSIGLFTCKVICISTRLTLQHFLTLEFLNQSGAKRKLSTWNLFLFHFGGKVLPPRYCPRWSNSERSSLCWYQKTKKLEFPSSKFWCGMSLKLNDEADPCCALPSFRVDSQ